MGTYLVLLSGLGAELAGIQKGLGTVRALVVGISNMLLQYTSIPLLVAVVAVALCGSLWHHPCFCKMGWNTQFGLDYCNASG